MTKAHEDPQAKAREALTGKGACDEEHNEASATSAANAGAGDAFSAAQASMEALMPDDVILLFEKRLQDSFKKPSQGLPHIPSAAINPEIISMILQAVMEMIKSCRQPQPETVKQMRSPGRLAEFQVRTTVRQRLREEYGFGGYARFGGDALTDHALGVAKKATDNERAALVSAASQLVI